MKIKVLRNLGHGLPQLKEGQVVNVDEGEGARLCNLGLAVDVSPPAPKVVVAVPPEPVKAVPAEPSVVAGRETADIEVKESPLKRFTKKSDK